MRIYPAATLSALGAVWSIDSLGWVTKNGTRTNGHATWLDFVGGSIVVQSPRTLTEWKTLNGSIWTETKTTALPRLLVMSATQASKLEMSTTTTINADLTPVTQRSSVAVRVQ